MSSAVTEMSSLVREAADYAPTSNWKDRVQAAARVLHMPFGRAKRHYYGEARRVDAEEMDRARAAVEDLRERRERQRAAEHVAWLSATLAHLRQGDTDFYREQIAGLEHALAHVGALDSAVADPDEPGEFSD